MAIEKILNTRIINKHDSLTNWENSTLQLKEGEIALAYVETTKPDGHGGSYTVPTYLMKVGVEGKKFSEVEWLAAPASDVYAWAKLENPTISQLPVNLRTAIENLQSAVGDGGSIAESIANAINALDSESTGEGTIVKSVVQTDGKVTVTMGTLSADEIPTLTASKISDFESTVATKVESYGYETIDNVNAYKEEVAELLEGKADEVHTHVKADITDFAHTHIASEITDFATEVAKVKVDEAVKATQDGNGNVIADTYAKQTTTYTKDEVDGEIEDAINTFVSAYITSDGGAIDKLQEIANWIDSDKNGSADIIADVETNAGNIESLDGRVGDIEGIIEGYGDIVSHNVDEFYTKEQADAAFTDSTEVDGQIDAKINALELSTTYEPIGAEARAIADAEGKINALADGAVKTNTESIATINDEENGILAQAKAYADGLNHEDTKYTAAEDGGLKLDENNAFSIDDSITWIFDCGDSGVTA